MFIAICQLHNKNFISANSEQKKLAKISDFPPRCGLLTSITVYSMIFCCTSKIRSLHIYVMHRMFYFVRYCTVLTYFQAYFYLKDFASQVQSFKRSYADSPRIPFHKYSSE